MRRVFLPYASGILLIAPFVIVAPASGQEASDPACNAACRWWMSFGKPAQAPLPAPPPPPVVKALAPARYTDPPIPAHDRLSPPAKHWARRPMRALDAVTPLAPAPPSAVTFGPPSKPWLIAIRGSAPVLASSFVRSAQPAALGPR